MIEDDYKHKDEVDGATRAANRIAPLILKLAPGIRSVVDLGGGTGAWLQVLHNLGVETIQLYDVPEAALDLLIERSCFQAVDLNKRVPPLTRFDLAVCVECAEHLRPKRALPLVKWLTSAADIVIFSAAIPGQPGKGHINARLPEYWQALFRQCGYTRCDVLRGSIVSDSSIPYWYRQNLFVFTKPAIKLAGEEPDFLPEDFALVHRDPMTELARPHLRFLLREMRRALFAAIWYRLRGSPK